MVGEAAGNQTTVTFRGVFVRVYQGSSCSSCSKFLYCHHRRCTPDQLLKVEENTEEFDLTPITNDMWLHHYSSRFGEESTKVVQERTKKTWVFKWNDKQAIKWTFKFTNENFKWKTLYQAKVRQQNDTAELLRDLYKQASEKKNSRKLQRIEVVTPPEKKRMTGFNGEARCLGRSGGGTSSRFSKPNNIGSCKGRLMKKSRAEFLASIRAEKRGALQLDLRREQASSTRKLGR
ncbi:hypothetical protein R1sor_013742 [Riccia sorocarpa]|uniref:Transposase n=1 Tax=Riccia sorocarpa TaxID=122646 RepID=A0ABD3H7K9_9MARC